MTYFSYINNDPLFNDVNSPPRELSSDVSTNHDFTIMEIKAAIKRLKLNKSSGADGMINEFV